MIDQGFRRGHFPESLSILNQERSQLWETVKSRKEKTMIEEIESRRLDNETDFWIRWFLGNARYARVQLNLLLLSRMREAAAKDDWMAVHHLAYLEGVQS
jgi:hypothetical protein